VVVIIHHRDWLRTQAALVGAASALAVVLGLTWYARDLINHGSPFWPFAAAPWGDPVPPLFDSYTSLLRGPTEAISGNVDNYLTIFSGGWLVLVAAILAPLWSRTHVVVVGAILTFASILLWSSAPTTGVSEFEGYSANVSASRYLLPVVALAAMTLALSARSGEGARAIVIGILATASAWSLTQIATGDAILFSKTWVVGAAFIGAIAALFLGRRVAAGGASWMRHKRIGAVAAVLGVTVAAVALSAAASGYSARYAGQSAYFDAGVVRWFEDPSRAADNRPIHMTPELFGMLAGDELKRSVQLIDLQAPCADVERLNDGGWVIIRDDPVLEAELGYTAYSCLADAAPEAEIDGYQIYAPNP
jgi:hypothetical protein